MSASKHIATLSVRLPKTEIRRFKSVAAKRGVTLQEAVHQALDSWTFGAKPVVVLPLDALEGSLTGVDVEKMMREDRKAELAKERSRLK